MKIVESISDRRLKYVENKLRKSGLLKFRDFNITHFNAYCKSYKSKDNRLILLKILAKAKEYPTMISTTTDNDIIQCRAGARRSMGDLYRLFLTYGPDISFKEFRSVLFQLVNQGVVYASYCFTISKRVFNRAGCSGALHLYNKVLYTSPFIDGRQMMDEFKFDLKVELDEQDKRNGYR
jgi:hypothetical protein